MICQIYDTVLKNIHIRSEKTGFYCEFSGFSQDDSLRLISIFPQKKEKNQLRLEIFHSVSALYQITHIVLSQI